MKAIVLNNDLTENGHLDLPKDFAEIKEHNLYLYVKYYLSSMRSNGAHVKTRGRVSGGGRKPWNQKGGGRARAGSITSPVFVGGGVSHGPTFRNFDIKINKKQKLLALKYALKQKADLGRLYIVEKIDIPSGKTKDASMLFKTLCERDALFAVSSLEIKTFNAFRNLQSCYIADSSELNAYLVASFRSAVIEKALFNKIIERG